MAELGLVAVLPPEGPANGSGGSCASGPMKMGCASCVSMCVQLTVSPALMVSGDGKKRRFDAGCAIAFPHEIEVDGVLGSSTFTYHVFDGMTGGPMVLGSHATLLVWLAFPDESEVKSSRGTRMLSLCPGGVLGAEHCPMCMCSCIVALGGRLVMATVT